MSRHARLTHGRSTGSSPSSSGSSSSTQPSHRSHRSHHSRHSNASRHASRRDWLDHGSRHCSHHSHRRGHVSRHRDRSPGVPIHCEVPKFNRGGPIPIKIWIQQMECYFSITGVPERKLVMGMINHFDTTHFAEVQPYKTYSYPEFRKKIIRIFQTPDLSDVNIE